VAHHKQAEKRNRQGERRRLRNKAIKTGVRTLLRKLDAAIDAGRGDEVKSLLRQVISRLDRATSKGVLSRRMTARKISQMTRRAAKSA
jgi:small subunit ribosomal protein S20